MDRRRRGQAGRSRAQQGGPLLSSIYTGHRQDCFSQLLTTAGTDPGPGHQPPLVHQLPTEHPAFLLGQRTGWGLWFLLSLAGDLAAGLFLRVTGSSERGMGSQSPRGQLHPSLRTSSCTKKLADYLFSSQQPVRHQEKTKCLPWGKTELPARGRRPSHCGEAACPASPRRICRASDLLPGPSKDCSGIHTNQHGGGKGCKALTPGPSIPRNS